MGFGSFAGREQTVGRRADRMDEYPESRHLARALERCGKLAAPWSGVVYRSASPRYANRDDLLTGVGAKHAGARWNPPQSFATVYTSLEIATAVAEALAHHRYYGLSEEKALPRVLVSIRVHLQRVLNLAAPRARRVLAVTRDRLIGEDWRACNQAGQEALPQAIGRLAWEAEWEGLLVPSSADRRGVNLIIFPGNLLVPKSYLRIINRDQLPPLR
jgi:RES domain-containing protein